MGNQSKRGRREIDESDPVVEWQEEARWSGYTGHARWPWSGNTGPRGRPDRFRMPGAGAWLGIAIVVAAMFGALWVVVWLLSKILP